MDSVYKSILANPTANSGDGRPLFLYPPARAFVRERMGKTILDIKDVGKNFGGVVAIRNVNLEVVAGEVVGLIGPNGAGKTTLLNVISGFYKPDMGRIRLNGLDVTGEPPHKVARAGVSRTFQIPKILRNLTVEENILSATIVSSNSENERLGERLLDFFGLSRLRDGPAKNLSGGQQKLLEFIRAVVQNSSLVMLDEPVGGVHPDMISQLGEVITELNREGGRTFLIVEHNIPFVAEVCSRVCVMSEGSVIASGSIEEVLHAESVIEAYLGGRNATG
ncbi:MAG: ABC transporter ATP-binding protein [Nitrososphaerota archaeon]